MISGSFTRKNDDKEVSKDQRGLVIQLQHTIKYFPSFSHSSLEMLEAKRIMLTFKLKEDS